MLHSFQIDKHMCYMTNYYAVNLEQILIEKKFHIEEIQALSKQLVEAVIVLRSKNIVHHGKLLCPVYIISVQLSKPVHSCVCLYCSFNPALVWIIGLE